MTGTKHIYIQDGNEEKVKEIEKREKSFSEWVNLQLKKYKIKG